MLLNTLHFTGYFPFQQRIIGSKCRCVKIEKPYSIPWASLVAQLVENPPAMQETLCLIPGLRRHSEGGHGNPLQNSCLENPHGQRRLVSYSGWVAKRQTQLRK